MKTLHLIRHAKSSWKDPGLTDIERPLNGRGRRACGSMAQHIVEAGCDFEVVFCSPAQRAVETITRLAEALEEVEVEPQLDRRLYTFDSRALLQWCQTLPETFANVVLVGHNPAITELTNALCHTDLENVPTCGYVQIGVNDTSWSELEPGDGILNRFLYPKKFEG